MIKPTTFFILFLILIGSALAVKPTQESTAAGELTVLYPKTEYVRQNAPLNLHFHIMNSTGWSINSSDLTCHIHLFNNTNSHSLKAVLEKDGPDMEIELNNSFTANLGIIAYNVWCNSSYNEAGFVSDSVLVTESGNQEDAIGSALLGFIILIPLIFGLFMLIGAATMNEEHHVFKIFLFLLSPISVWVSLHFAMVSLVKYYGLFDLQNSIGTTTYWMAWTFFVMISYFIIYSIWKMFAYMAQQKQESIKY